MHSFEKENLDYNKSNHVIETREMAKTWLSTRKEENYTFTGDIIN